MATVLLMMASLPNESDNVRVISGRWDVVGDGDYLIALTRWTA